MTTDSPQPTESEIKRGLEALRLSLFEEIDTIEGLLEPFKGSELDSLRSDLAEQTKRLESFNDNDLVPYKLQRLQKEIAKLRAKAEELAAHPLKLTKFQLVEQLNDIQETLQLIKATEPNTQDEEQKKIGEQAAALRARLNEIDAQLEHLEGRRLSAEKYNVQETLTTLKEQAVALGTRSFLLNEVRDVAKILESAEVGTLKRGELKILKAEIDDRKTRLGSLRDDELAAFRRDLSKLKEQTESLAQRQGFLAWLGSFSIVFWLALVPYVLFVYMAYDSVWQSRNRTTIHLTATAHALAYPSPTVPPEASATPEVALTQTLPTPAQTLTSTQTETTSPTTPTETATPLTPAP